VAKKSKSDEPKIHLPKYFVLHPMTAMHVAFLNAKFRTQMHTEGQWKKIIDKALTTDLRIR